MKKDIFVKLKKLSSILFYRLAKRYGNIVDKDDFFSQILTSFLEEEDSIDDLYAFVFKKGRNIFLKELRSIKKKSYKNNIDEMMRISRSVESKADIKHKISGVFHNFKFLTYFQRKLLFAYIVEEKSLKELSKKFKLSAPTLRKELKKAFETLKKGIID